jgi:hypothetical protein
LQVRGVERIAAITKRHDVVYVAAQTTAVGRRAAGVALVAVTAGSWLRRSSVPRTGERLGTSCLDPAGRTV